MDNKITKKLKLSFYGGARIVTGSNFLLESETSKILVDCGLFQGCEFCDEKNRESFRYNPAEIDALFVTHSHIDHIGRIPKLVKDGFNGTIYSTLPARDIAQIMLEDSLKVFKYNSGERKHEPLYGEKDVKKTMELWETLPYNKEVTIKNELKVKFYNSGHVLGSSMVEVVSDDKKIVFTGDMGGSSDPILPDIDIVSDVNYLVMESVYGDREHGESSERQEKLKNTIEDTINKRGILMIPSFSLERTQQLLFDLNDLVENKKIPDVPIFLDSPLAIKITEIYKKHSDYFNDTAKKIIQSGDDIFKFANFRSTPTTKESMSIKSVDNPKVIIAGSGMSTGGRILHHEKKYLSDSNNTLLMIGYQAAGTLGRELQEGAKTVTISGEKIRVNALVDTISGYSAHMGSEDLIDFTANSADTLKKVFVVMGEPSASLYLTQKIRDYTGIDAVVPEDGESIEL